MFKLILIGAMALCMNLNAKPEVKYIQVEKCSLTDKLDSATTKYKKILSNKSLKTVETIFLTSTALYFSNKSYKSCNEITNVFYTTISFSCIALAGVCIDYIYNN